MKQKLSKRPSQKEKEGEKEGEEFVIVLNEDADISDESDHQE